MNSLKKVLGLLMALAVALSLTACDSESGVRVIEDNAIQPEYLSLFSQSDISGNDITKYWIELFTGMYDKQVYIDFNGASYYAEEGLSYRELLEKRLGSASPDDLYIINAEDVLAFDKKGYWMDLSGMNFVKNLSEAALYQSTYNGRVFSVPLSFTGFGFIWNVDMLAQYGLTVPENLEAFLTVCERLKIEGVLPYGANKGFGLTVPAMCVGFSKLYGSGDQNGRIAALNSAETPVSAYIRDGYEFLAMMIEEGYMDPRQALEATPGQEDITMFLAGECAFICSGLAQLGELPTELFQMEMTGLPVLEEGSVAVYGADKRLCVNPNSKHLDTALQFIEMVGTYEALEQSARLGKAISSSNANTIPSSNAASKLIALLQRADQIPNQDFSLHFNTWESIRDVARTICAGESVDQACNLLDEKQRANLAEYGTK